MRGPVEINTPTTAGSPDEEHARYIRGLLALRDGDPAAAAELLTLAVQRQPSHYGMRRNLVRALLAAGRFQHALVQADACLSQAPDDAELHFARGTALNGLKEPVQACTALSRAVTLQPDHAAAWLNLANAWADLDDLEVAEHACREAIRLEPTLPEAHASLGFILTMRGHVTAAIEACEAAIRLRPELTQAHWNRAIALLLQGDLPGGFAAFEWRKKHAPFRADFPPLARPAWRGSDPAGQTVLVRAEQGAGDTIQFVRFVASIRDGGGRPVLVCAPSLMTLMQSMTGVEVVSSRDPLPPFDTWVDLMSLPYVLGTTMITLPGASGYLRADPARVRTWRERLPLGRKVGVAFAGNPSQRNDRRRSIPCNLAAPLPEIPNVTFINLQVGPTAPGLGLPDLSGALTNYAETAALIECLDLVISVDTSVAHLAGALGKPVRVLLPAAPDWRWLMARADSPWYASARLIRQRRAGEWRPVLEDAMRDLSGIGDATGGVRMPPAAVVA